MAKSAKQEHRNMNRIFISREEAFPCGDPNRYERRIGEGLGNQFWSPQPVDLESVRIGWMPCDLLSDCKVVGLIDTKGRWQKGNLKPNPEDHEGKGGVAAKET